ncbi:transporter, LysE family protein [Pseudooceanicola batsensis HTCC2597]|uniref:Transporter, LysE family protein n=1 Tax=Pseudooceanicola batsensis (strain ATCC BAA-863 / DSM 15984 / KCTC 12145 / HTCC2597) TaxID=252305 RepID=A3TY01_PSEBH|nr:LysE family translocator [Pseudooceanicola batsensis]EAQ03035.1 transporter, LysE family protein [Pseudooceanicola batsensis HTCC2597]
MTLSPTELAFYAGALFILFLTPGPVWLALTARALSGGFHAAWPLALGVVIGDALWPLLAVLGVSWLVAQVESFMVVLRYVGAIMFLTMGVLLIRNADKTIASDSRLTRPGMWAGFVAGLVVILGNPKAILFYMGVLPGFFDLTAVTIADIAAIMSVSMLVPFVGNLIFALMVDRVRRLLASGRAMRRTNIGAGGLMILVGLVIPFT